MEVAIVEPFYTGSHKTWVDDLCRFSKHQITPFTLQGRHWKWRMGAGAIELAQLVNQSRASFDVFLVTDMLDVAVFKSMLDRRYRDVKVILYMHENQIVYPYQTPDSDKNRDRHYGLINYKSVVSADVIWFNSNFHRDIFYTYLAQFLRVFPDSKFHIELANATKVKSAVVPIGIDCEAMEVFKQKKPNRPTILWNHRWEYDKNPQQFFRTLFQLSDHGFDFDVHVVGEQYTKSPTVFKEAKKKLVKHIKHWGFVKEKSEYYAILWQSNLIPVTANQEFFGLSVLEAMYCGCRPILPNRLSYSDLYKDLNVFYNDDDELYATIKHEITRGVTRDFTAFAAQYDWNEVIKLYDVGLLID